MPYQGSYSYKFGGDTTIICPANILSAFVFIRQTSDGQPKSNCGSTNGSAHYLADIGDFLRNKWGFGDTSNNINLCEGCHNPHKAQRHYYPVDSKGTSPISRPSTHDGDWDVYGAELTERMSSYASPQTYLAPYYYNGAGHEPDGGDQQYGANMPDYVTLCTDCHNSTNTIDSTRLDRPLYKFDWNTEKHGRAAARDHDCADFELPYYDNQSGNYVLSCTDCHEPHGSPNPFLIRQKVNDGAVSMGNWKLLCQNCHKDRGHSLQCEEGKYGPHRQIYLEQLGNCEPCHLTSEDPPGVYLGPCTECHYHGGSFTLNDITYKTF
jgi:predicted CXXCH cytochrome family protein